MKFIPVLDMARPDQSYSNLIHAVVRGDYDIVVSDMTVTSARRRLATFSTSIFDNALRLIVRKPKIDQVALLSHLGPFSLRLWMLILATTICTSVLVCLVERHHNETLRHRSMLSMEAMSLWYSIGNIMGYGVDFHVTTISGRILTVALYILSLVLVASYTANLASNLTTFKAEYIIKSIDEMKQGKLPHNRIGVRMNSVVDDFFVREISGGSRNYHRLHSLQELLKGLLNGDIDVSFMDSGRGEYLTSSVYCNLTLIGPSFDASTFGIVFPKNWLYIDEFDINVLALRESGELDKLRKRWFGIHDCEATAEMPKAMGLDSMSGLFLTVGIVVFVAILTQAWTKRMTIRNSLQAFQGRG
jgi:ABC-type amino acid transport substrate-binding protein